MFISRMSTICRLSYTYRTYMSNLTGNRVRPLQISETMKRLYKEKLLPVESNYRFHEFHSPPLEDADFDAKPMVLLVGQYSTGKTTFIRYLIGQDFPGLRVGPEPTTDKFIVVSGGDRQEVIPGNALAVDSTKQFRQLSQYGNSFLQRLQCSTVNNKVLESVTMIDTPGILSGEKQRVDRGYDYAGVMSWFAERADLIVLLFDAHKLDISDEFKRVIESLKAHDEKIRVVLNKADMIDTQSLMRVYGALMWSLGKILQTPEVNRVYIGSFWDEPLRYDDNRKLFEAELSSLMDDIQSLPRYSSTRKLNDLIKRSRLAKVHLSIMNRLKADYPFLNLFNRESSKEKLIQSLAEIFLQIQREEHVSPGDFPDVRKMQQCLGTFNWSKMYNLKPKLIENIDKLSDEISQLIKDNAFGQVETSRVTGGVFSHHSNSLFNSKLSEGINRGRSSGDWIVSKFKLKYDEIFSQITNDGKYVNSDDAKRYLIKTKLSSTELTKIWKLADVDENGLLDDEEFALAMYLVDLKLQGHELPNKLPQHLLPPSRIHQLAELDSNAGESGAWKLPKFTW